MTAFSHHPAPGRDSSGSTQSDSVCLFIFVNVLSSIMRHFITTNKATVGNGIPVELFQILEDDAVKVLHSVCQHLENSSDHGTGKGQFSFQSRRKAMPKKAQTTAQLHSSYMLAK